MIQTNKFNSTITCRDQCKIDEASIIDAETGKTVKNIMFKNKYNLDRYISVLKTFYFQTVL